MSQGRQSAVAVPNSQPNTVRVSRNTAPVSRNTAQASRIGGVSQKSASNPGLQAQGDSCGTRMSQRSPAPPISRTPSADRRLLRALTVSPNQDDAGDASPEPEYTRNTPSKASPMRQSTQTRQPTQGPSGRSPTVSQRASARETAEKSPTVTPSQRASEMSQISGGGALDAVDVRLPTPPGEVKEVC